MNRNSPEPSESRLDQVLQRAVVGGLTGLLFLGALAMVTVHLFDQTAWQSYYARVQLFGAGCRAVVLPWNGSFDEVKAKGMPLLKPQMMPYRGTPSPPHVQPGQALLTACTVDLRPLVGHGYPVISLGPILGHSRVYYNDRLVVEASSDGPIDFPVSPAELEKPSAELTVVSQRTERANPGMASLLPPYATAERGDVRRIGRYLTSYLAEQPPLLIGISAMIAAFVLLLYFNGLGYADVLWLAAFAATMGLQSLCIYGQNFTAAVPWLFRAESTACLFQTLTICFFHLHVIRRDKVSTLGLGLACVTVMLGTAVLFLASEQTIYDWRLYYRTPLLINAAAIGAVYLSLLPRLSSIKGVARRRFWRFAALAALSVVTSLVEVVLEDKAGIYIKPVSQIILVVTYAAVMVADLARRQAQYFAELQLRQQTETEAVEARAVATAARMLAHDIRRPLDLARLLQAEALASDDAGAVRARLGPEIVASHQRIDAMLEELVHLGGPMLLARQPVTAETLVADALTDARRRGLFAGLTVTGSVAGLMLDVDPQRLRRVLDNLLENAAHATPQGGKLMVAAALDEASDQALLSVHNTGSFVPEELRERLFDLAFTQGKVGSSGLGLTLARQVVRAHGGWIRCDSSAEGGTKFVFVVPQLGSTPLTGRLAELLAAPPLELAAGPKANEVATAPLLVLVEDDELVRLAWAAVVKDARLRAYSSPEACLAAWPDLLQLALGAPLMVVTDQNFPAATSSGLELARTLKALHAGIPIVLSSSGSGIRLGAGAPVDLVIDKAPRSYGQLVVLLAQASTTSASKGATR